MKKLFLLAALSLSSFSAVHAQSDDPMLFNHLSVGISTGTPGLIGFDVATTCTPYLQIRAGMAIMPRFKYNTSVKLSSSAVNDFNSKKATINSALVAGGMPEKQVTANVANEYDVQGKFGFTNGKILFDVFPFTSNGFPVFVTVGAYFGTSEIISVYNEDAGSVAIVNQANDAINAYRTLTASATGVPAINNIYAELGQYRLQPDAAGDMKFNVKVNGFKPYLGIGFGRAVPKTKRVGFVCEIGCMFWKTPSVIYTGRDDKGNSNISIDPDLAGDKNVAKAIDIISKFKVYPCLNFRICGKIF